MIRSTNTKNGSDMMGIAYQTIGFQKKLDEETYKKYSAQYPEITEEMNFIEIMKIVNKKPVTSS